MALLKYLERVQTSKLNVFCLYLITIDGIFVYRSCQFGSSKDHEDNKGKGRIGNQGKYQHHTEKEKAEIAKKAYVLTSYKR